MLLWTKIPPVMRAVRKATVGRRKIHADLPEDIHQKLRVKAALEDLSIQVFIACTVEQAAQDVPIPAGVNHRSGKAG
jgi:hypothetical protein